MAALVEIYTRPGCGYCSAAKSLLARKNAAFTEFDVAVDPNWRAEMVQRSNGGATFPQIFIDKQHVGEGALLDDAKLAVIGIARTGQGEERGIVGCDELQRLGG